MKKLRSLVAHHWGTLAVYAALGLALWPVPLLGLVHVEASAVVAGVAFFVSGIAALGAFRKRTAEASLGRVLAAQEALLLVPLLLLTATLAWRPNCDYPRGLLLYLAMPPVTVAFTVGLAYGLTGLGIRYCKTALVFIGVAVTLGGPLYDLGGHPQFYTYNHVFGGVLGPIYDRDLALRPGFFAFRGLTLLWAVLFALVGRWGRRMATPRDTRRAPAAALVTVLLIGAAYANAARLGFNTPAWRTQEVLGGHLRTAHFDLFYDPEAVSQQELAYLAEDHEWHYRRLREALGTAPRERVVSYLYPDEATKARLTGARRTSVAPVWLGRPQVHLLLDAYQRSFGHELVHAFSRSFGLPLVNASRSVGLVEGLAVAFEPPSGRPSPADQVSAAALLGAGDRPGYSLAEGVAARLSPVGFWTGRGAVGYTTMGAFVRFLDRRYGTEKLRAVYAWANFEEVYGKPVRVLAEEWEQALQSQRGVAHAAGALAEWRFSQPSLFEARCPHHVPAHRRAYRSAERALAAGDTARAAAAFEEAVGREPAFEAARVSLARLLMASGDGPSASGRSVSDRALRLLHAAPDSVHGAGFFVARGDAQALEGRPAAARRSYERAAEQLLPYRHEARALVALRRALAVHPRLMKVIVGPGTSQVRARRLEAAGSLPPAAAVLHAVLLGEGNRFDRAVQQLEQAPPVETLESAAARSAGGGRLRRQRLVWQAQWAHRAGRPSQAGRYARRAVRAYRALGDRDAAARWDAFAEKMQWVAGRQAASAGGP